MKSMFYKTLVLAGALAPSAVAFSLYDAAPIVGVPESYAIRYNAYLNVGYDDNVNNSVNDKKSGGYVRFGVGASYADYESVTRLSYNAKIGAQLYNETAYGTDNRMFSDMSFNAKLTRTLGRGSVYSAEVSLSYTPEPEYSGYYSNVGVDSSRLNWGISNVYSQPIDERWSWNVSLAYSGCVYDNDMYYQDDRMYLTPGLGLSYKASERTTYGISTTYRYEFRQEGSDSESVFVTGNVSHLLSPVSSFTARVGAQYKMVGSWGEWTPTLQASYRRELAEGLSINAYANYSNENVDSYNWYNNSNYRSVNTWRLGVAMRYVYTHRVSFGAYASIYSADYSNSDKGSRGYSNDCWTVGCSMDYIIDKNLTATVGYSYENNEYSTSGAAKRNRITTGLKYSF